MESTKYPNNEKIATAKAADIALAEKARQKDMDAFCELYDRYKDRYFQYAYYKLRHAQDAEDAVAECAMALWRQIAELREPAAFSVWSFRILSAICNRMIKGQIQRKEEVALDETGAAAVGNHGQIVRHGSHDISVPDHGEQTANRLVVEKALALLDEEAREIVLLAVVAGFRSTEIAEATGKKPGTVRSILSRSLKKMRAELEK